MFFGRDFLHTPLDFSYKTNVSTYTVNGKIENKMDFSIPWGLIL